MTSSIPASVCRSVARLAPFGVEVSWSLPAPTLDDEQRAAPIDSWIARCGQLSTGVLSPVSKDAQQQANDDHAHQLDLTQFVHASRLARQRVMQFVHQSFPDKEGRREG